MIREQIEAKLRAAFDPMYLEVVDESYRHNVPAGSESHFKVVLVSDRFTGERFLNRHRMIYGTLTEELSNTVHAPRCTPTRLKNGKRYRIRFSPRRRAAARGASPRNPICNRWRFSSMLLADLAKTAYGPFCFTGKCANSALLRTKLSGKCEKCRSTRRQPFSTHKSDAAIMPRLIYECLRDDSDDRECVSDLKRASRFCEATYTRFQS